MTLVDLIAEAVASRCEGNVGIVLSGGLDSATTLAWAKREGYRSLVAPRWTLGHRQACHHPRL